MPEHLRNDDHPSGESSRVARARRRDARRHHCDVAEPDRATEFERFKTLAGRRTEALESEEDEPSTDS